MPEVASTLAIPQALRSQGIQRYGFHGLSCESIVRQLAGRLPGRLLIAHLGNGASVTAVRDGKSIDTSMGLTPSGGLIMGTRRGDLDPGVLIYLMREKGFDADRLEDIVDYQAGLLGISGVAGDMRRLHEAAAANPGARLAIKMFCYSVRKVLAAMAAAHGGVDAIVFTGGSARTTLRCAARSAPLSPGPGSVSTIPRTGLQTAASSAAPRRVAWSTSSLRWKTSRSRATPRCCSRRRVAVSSEGVVSHLKSEPSDASSRRSTFGGTQTSVRPTRRVR